MNLSLATECDKLGNLSMVLSTRNSSTDCIRSEFSPSLSRHRTDTLAQLVQASRCDCDFCPARAQEGKKLEEEAKSKGPLIEPDGLGDSARFGRTDRQATAPYRAYRVLISSEEMSGVRERESDFPSANARIASLIELPCGFSLSASTLLLVLLPSPLLLSRCV